MTNIQADQKTFMYLCDTPMFTIDSVIDDPSANNPALLDNINLCHNLIEEEAIKELLPALKELKAILSGEATEFTIKELLDDIFDGGLDTIYVIMQLFNTLDLPFETGWFEVCDNNNSKAVRQDDGTYKVIRRPSDGKIQKPEGWKPPQLAKILQEHYERRKA